jgi:hypothetical protein
MKQALGVLIAAVALGPLGACSSSSEDAPALSDAAAVHPAKLFTGFDDGSAEYKVPASLVGASDSTTVRWTIADTSLATVDTEQPSPGEKATTRMSHHAIVKTKKAGTTTLRATVEGKTFDVPLTITQYAPGARELGNDLYQTNRASMPGGEPGTKALGCIDCHGAHGTARHSPSEIGGFDDAAILKTIATGVKPDGGTANNGNHKFVLDMTEQQGILARLRSLEPVEFPQ